MEKKYIVKVLIGLIVSFGLISCGGGSDDEPTSSGTTTLSGTAATGAAIVGRVSITGSQGNIISVLIDSAGNYSANVEGLTPPFILSAIPTDSSLATQYSFASVANVQVNITPLTTLVLFIANSNNNLSDLELAWNGQFNTFNQQTIDVLKLIINANFQTILTDAGVDSTSFDIFSSSFNTDSNGFDGVLDLITFIIDDTTDSFTLTVSGVPAFSFDENINNTASFGSLALTGTGTVPLGLSAYAPDEVSYSSLATGEITVETFIWSITEAGTTYLVTITKTTGSEDTLLVSLAASTDEALTTWRNDSVLTNNLVISENSVEFINLELQELALSPTFLSLTGTLDL